MANNDVVYLVGAKQYSVQRESGQHCWGGRTICFYLTSVYFMTVYTFFLKTGKEPSFRGFYEARFSSKQKRLMKLHNFDIEGWTYKDQTNLTTNYY